MKETNTAKTLETRLNKIKMDFGLDEKNWYINFFRRDCLYVE